MVGSGIRLADCKRRYRTRIEIAADILEIARDGCRKTKIMYLGNLSFDVLRRYLDMLATHGLIEFRNPQNSYVATDKGRRFLEEYHELQKHSEMVETKKRVLETTLSPGVNEDTTASAV
jgi:predicted transcriptional regulator